jgi:type VI secretion system secreted protein Hcp
MAIDAYLQIDGIKGESQDSAHQGWIELISAEWGVLQPKSATASTAGGHTAERCEHRSISISKLADLSSPLLMIELENVLIGGIHQAVHDGSILQDAVSLKFSKVKWKYTQQKIGGGAGGNTTGGWDLATNRIA